MAGSEIKTENPHYFTSSHQMRTLIPDIREWWREEILIADSSCLLHYTDTDPELPAVKVNMKLLWEQTKPGQAATLQEYHEVGNYQHLPLSQRVIATIWSSSDTRTHDLYHQPYRYASIRNVFYWYFTNSCGKISYNLGNTCSSVPECKNAMSSIL